ncbi:hypothetical protein GGR50DRAFT_637427 [Xylaria sp. CBS 124048]|nr:hypothetical protein GGR50DRAFT_637427 [Xylaria sp. CBS 124048]
MLRCIMQSRWHQTLRDWITIYYDILYLELVIITQVYRINRFIVSVTIVIVTWLLSSLSKNITNSVWLLIIRQDYAVARLQITLSERSLPWREHVALQSLSRYIVGPSSTEWGQGSRGRRLGLGLGPGRGFRNIEALVACIGSYVTIEALLHVPYLRECENNPPVIP